MSYEANKQWRLKNPNARNLQRARNYKISQTNAKQARKAWTDEEDLLVQNYDGTDHELGSEIDRSVQAIQVRRAKLKKKNVNP